VLSCLQYCVKGDRAPASFQPVRIEEVKDAPLPAPPERPLTPVDKLTRFSTVDQHAVQVGLPVNQSQITSNENVLTSD